MGRNVFTTPLSSRARERLLSNPEGLLFEL